MAKKGHQGCFRVPMQTQEKDRQMENKPAQNIQDSFLNTARKDKSQITIYLLSGVKLTGRIRSFDKYSVVLETNNQEQLIFKHAISTVVMAKGSHFEGRPHSSAAEGESTSGKSEG
jgi:host factor-I protein